MPPVRCDASDRSWRLWGLTAKIRRGRQILIQSMDAKSAFSSSGSGPGQIDAVSVEYFPGDFLAIDLRLQFGWSASPGWWLVIAGAVHQTQRVTNKASAMILAMGMAPTQRMSKQRRPRGKGWSRYRKVAQSRRSRRGGNRHCMAYIPYGCHGSGGGNVRRSWGGGGSHVMHGRSRMTIYPCMPTMPGRSTTDFHRQGRHC